MRQDPANPARNCLPGGITEADLIAGIEASGYPLQGLVASQLIDHFGVTEEWGYIDRDSKDHRTLDIHAYRRIPGQQKQTMSAALVLLIECKRSAHPFVFFKSVPDRAVPKFPPVYGIGRPVSVSSTSQNLMRELSVADALGLGKTAFAEPGPPKCASFSKATPSGKKVELSGAEPFNSIILPLEKAMIHAAGLYSAAPGPGEPMYPTLTLCVGVIDAPMILIDGPQNTSNPILCPWVRVVRQEANTDKYIWERTLWYVMDCVHIDFFADFIHKHLLPFTETFAERAIRQEVILRVGGFVDSLDNWEWDQIRSHKS